MTQNIEAALETQNASRIEYEPQVGNPWAIPVVTSHDTGRMIGEEFNHEHPDHGECVCKVTDRYHSEKKIRRLIKEEITFADWMRAKIWRLKRRLS